LEPLNRRSSPVPASVGIFPIDAATIRLVDALLLEQEEWKLNGWRVFSELSSTKLDHAPAIKSKINQ
jgi:hypothetical protein